MYLQLPLICVCLLRYACELFIPLRLYITQLQFYYTEHGTQCFLVLQVKWFNNYTKNT